MNQTFKQHFPTWQDFKKFLIDYSVYYQAEEYSDQKALIYWTLLFRRYGNSHTAYDMEVFFEQLSLVVAERFREFFKIRELLNLVNSKNLEELIVGIETITDVADNPNIAEPDINFIGRRTKSKSRENIVDRVRTLIRGIRVNEIETEMGYYQDLFIRIIPRTHYVFPPEDENED